MKDGTTAGRLTSLSARSSNREALASVEIEVNGEHDKDTHLDCEVAARDDQNSPNPSANFHEFIPSWFCPNHHPSGHSISSKTFLSLEIRSGQMEDQ